MDSPIIQRRDYDQSDQSNQSNDQTTNLNPTSSEENSKYIIIHITIIFSVVTFIVIIGVILYLYRRRLRRLKSHTTNLNQIVNITHLTNTDDIILDYYSNDYSYDYNKSSSESKITYPQLEPLEPVQEIDELRPTSSPTQTLTKENRNYFIYAKGGGRNKKKSVNNNIKNNNENIKLNSNTNNNDETIKLKSDENNDEANNILNSSIKRLNSKKRTKIDFSLISSQVTSPSDSIYNNETADSLSRTTTRVVPPIPTFLSNKYTQPREILRGPEMAGNYLIRQDSDAYTDVSDATITIDTIINDNPIMGVTKIITSEEAVLDMIPINGYDGGSNLKF